MDRKWMLADCLTSEYREGVDGFLKFATKNAKNPEKMSCPCLKCYNTKRASADSLRFHLISNGIDPLYTLWIWHGEDEKISIGTNVPSESSDFFIDNLEKMTEVVEEDFTNQPEVYDNLLNSARQPLNSSCTWFSRLFAMLRLYNLKAAHGWFDKSFTALLELLKEMLPEDTMFPQCTCEARKILCIVGLEYEKIHACCNECVLFRKEYASLDKCPNCGEPRYKRDKVLSKVEWYFPIIPRFVRLYADVEEAKMVC